MTAKEELKNILLESDITRRTSLSQVRQILASAGLPREEYQVADGASKMCIILRKADFVIKWSTGHDYESGFDEAYDEVLIYQRAIKAGLEMFFPKTEVFCTYNGINFIIQEKIDFSTHTIPMSKENRYSHKTRTVSPAVVEKMDNCFYQMRRGRELNPLWASMAIILYGKRKCKALCRFIIENDINDLHGSNIGYLKDKPIILDFSGYHRD